MKGQDAEENKADDAAAESAAAEVASDQDKEASSEDK